MLSAFQADFAQLCNSGRHTVYRVYNRALDKKFLEPNSYDFKEKHPKNKLSGV